MIVLPCSKKLDTKQFKSKFKFKDLRFASPDEVKQITGLEIGSIPPFGSLFGLTTYIHTALGASTQIAFNAGDVSRSIIMNYSDWLALEQPVFFG